jgi:hypothetical protein
LSSARPSSTSVRAFADEGLDAAEPVLVAAPGPAIGLLREHLNGHGRRMSWADMSRIGANPARIIPAIRVFASSYPGRPVRCVAQPLWDGRTAAQRRETIRHEALINLAFTDIPVSILCPCDETAPDAGIAASAGLTHPMLIRGGSAQPSAAYDAATTFPAGCDQPLDPVPDDAAVLAYRDDLHMVRAFVTEYASGAGGDRRRAGDLVIAVRELAGNTYRHTGSGGRLSIWATAEELLCQAGDTGHISGPLAGRRHPDPTSAARGCGLCTSFVTWWRSGRDPPGPRSACTCRSDPRRQKAASRDVRTPILAGRTMHPGGLKMGHRADLVVMRQRVDRPSCCRLDTYTLYDHCWQAADV